MTRAILNRSNFIVFAAALLIFLYIYAALTKLFDLQNFKTVLERSPLIGENTVWVSWSIPVVEIIVSIFLFFPRFRKYGYLSSSILMAVFTLYIGYMIMFVPKLPCSCGGVMSKLTWPQHLLFNSAFFAVSIIGWALCNKESKVLLQ